MAGPNYFQITNGLLAFEVVDTAAVGYDADWKAPGGGTLTDVVMADYDADAVTSAWSCQIQSAVLTPAAVTNDQTINPTFCENQSVIPAPGISTWTLDVEMYQQIAVETGLDAFLFAHDAEELYFMIGFGGSVTTPTPAVHAPKAIGRVIGMPVAFGGAAYVPLTATFSLQLKGVPDIAYGSGAVVMAGVFTPPPAKSSSDEQAAVPVAFATIEQVGPSWDDIADKLVRELKVANKTVGKQVAAVGKKAMLADLKSRRGTLSFGGGRLNVKAKVRASSAGCDVTFTGQSAGAWAIISTGTKPHTIRVRNRKALHWDADAYATEVHHPGTRGRQYWRSAGRALDEAVADIIGDVYDDALAA